MAWKAGDVPQSGREISSDRSSLSDPLLLALLIKLIVEQIDCWRQAKPEKRRAFEVIDKRASNR